MRKPHARLRASGLALASIWVAFWSAPVAAQQSRCTLPNEVLEVLQSQAVSDVRDVPNSLRSSQLLTGLARENESIARVLSVVDAVPALVDDTVDNTSTVAVRAANILCDLLSVPEKIAVQTGIAQIATSGFTGAILGRLDGARGTAAAGDMVASASYGGDGTMALGRVQKGPNAPPPGPTGPFTVYAMGNFQGGNSDVPGLAGFSYDSVGGLFGMEFSVNRNLILGLAGGVVTTDVALDGNATLDAAALQAAAYLSYATRNLFLDLLAAYGAVDLDSARPGGAVGPVRGSTDGGSWALAARGGYLFEFGKLRAGPIAGITYINTEIGGYTETGDPQLTMTVGSQTVESLSGSAGVRFLAPFQADGRIFIPYLNVTLEHQFGDDIQAVVVTPTQPPNTPVALSLPVFDARDYGKVEGGLTIELAPSATLNVSGASTFARDDGDDWRVGAGLNYRF